MPSPAHLRRLAAPAVLAALCLQAMGDARTPHLGVAFQQAMPRTVLWAWEEPEDLRAADPRTVGVAYLAETLELGDRLTALRRHHPLQVAPDAAVMAVVRIETRPGFRDSAAMRLQTSSALTELSRRPGLRALQVDFDATRSQRGFYAAVLNALRPQMPAAMPLSITALVDWCAGDSAWLAQLPVDEAVPMFFRLGGHARPYGSKSYTVLREPLCRGSVGLSTDESWPTERPSPDSQPTGQSRRVYLFSPQPWQPQQLLAAAAVPQGERAAVLRIRDDAAHALRAGIDDTGLRRPEPSASPASEVTR